MNIFDTDTLEIAAPQIAEITGVALVARVILYDDDEHTIEEVALQLELATGCSESKAMSLTMQVHNTGRATVFDGEMVNCLRVSSVLEEIALHTEIAY
jgi:ATP-dependent Clp protease adapter protein ClpS